MSSKPDVRMSQSEIGAFLGSMDLAMVAYRAADGTLRARPAYFRTDGGSMLLEGCGAIPTGAAAGAVVDSYPAYDAIKGVLLHGVVTSSGGQSVLAIDHASGFDFAKVNSGK